jgi:hypothetical protein
LFLYSFSGLATAAFIPASGTAEVFVHSSHGALPPSPPDDKTDSFKASIDAGSVFDHSANTTAGAAASQKLELQANGLVANTHVLADDSTDFVSINEARSNFSLDFTLTEHAYKASFIGSITEGSAVPLSSPFRNVSNQLALTGPTNFSLSGEDLTTLDAFNVGFHKDLVLLPGKYHLDLASLAHTEAGAGAVGAFGVGLSLTPVPLPAACWLLGSALLGWLGISRRIART